MVDWKRLGLAVLCSATLIGGGIVLPKMLLILTAVVGVCILTYTFYKILDDIL